MFNFKKNLKFFTIIAIFSIISLTSFGANDTVAGATKKVGERWNNKKEVIIETTTSEKIVDTSAGATKKIEDRWTNKTEIKKDYIGLSETSNGITSKLEVIYENDKIVDLKYEEISSIKKEDNKNLKIFTDIIHKEVLKSQSLINFSTDNLDLNLPDIKIFYNNYMSLAKKIKSKK